ncbi:MAG TPA: pyridoxine 5'-phosphate synthase [Phycisphaerae bacterium]|nr:pyridoxine 5'-phosphate synthase [Phycisphaerae bacterium]
MTALSVNVNKVALVRNSRGGEIPSVVEAARLCIEAGCHGITVHPRPDQRHIRPRDVYDLAEMLHVEFNIEGNPFAGKDGSYPGFMNLVRDVRPAQATLVPDDPGQLTSDHGWNIRRDMDRLRPIIDELKGLGVRVSLFMDPDLTQIEAVPRTEADRVELYTEDYARAYPTADRDDVTGKYATAAACARDLGLGVNAGHDLNLDNLAHFLRTVPGVLEVSIGHALVSDALMQMGLPETVKAYLKCLP